MASGGSTPIVTRPDTPYEFGVANVVRYRGQQAKFLDAFENIPGPRYKNERESVTIIACGPMVPEAMRAAWILKEEYAMEARIVTVHTVKPPDVATLVQAADETRVVLPRKNTKSGASGISLPAQFCGSAKISANPCSSIWWASPIASAFRAIPGN